MTVIVLRGDARSLPLPDASVDLAQWRTTDPAERAKAMQVPKPPPVPEGQNALFELG